MQLMVRPWYSIDSALYRKGVNQELCNRREDLQGELPTEGEYSSLYKIGSEQDGEEQLK